MTEIDCKYQKEEDMKNETENLRKDIERINKLAEPTRKKLQRNPCDPKHKWTRAQDCMITGFSFGYMSIEKSPFHSITTFYIRV